MSAYLVVEDNYKFEGGKVEKNFDRLGIMDFFNILFVGGIFIVCVCWICPPIWNWYLSINKEYKMESYVGIIVISFTIGLILQEAGVFWDKQLGHIELNTINNFLLKNIILNNKTITNKIINNKFKLQVYREYGKQILANKSIRYKKEFTAEQCRYIYSYCFYYIEVRGKSDKYEKMRGLFDLSRSLIISSVILSVWSCLVFIYTMKNMHYQDTNIVNLFQIFLFSSIALVFYFRAKRIMRYRVRMVMGVYESCKEFPAE